MPGNEIQLNKLSLGTKISLITNAQYRYEGIVAAINSIEGTLTLQNVRFWGTENRKPGNDTIQSNENKAPAVGALFDSITFWISSIVQTYILDNKIERNEIGDKAVVKAAISMDNNRNTGRRQRNWWYAAGDQQRSVRLSPTGTGCSMGNVSVSMSRYNNAENQQHMISQPRMLVSYPRRGRNMGLLSRQTSYVPVVPIVPPGGSRRSGYGPNVRGGSFRLLTTPVSSGMGSMNSRGNGRKPTQPMRRIPNGDGRRYTPGGVNPRGGVFVYLPPEVATTYHPRPVNLLPPRSSLNRRPIGERRATTRGSVSVEPEVDCTTPYDFESANAELEAELAKINLNVDRTSPQTSHQEFISTGSRGTANEQAASTGDGLISNLQISSTTVSGTISNTVASGDSSAGVVSSTLTGNSSETNFNGVQGSSEGTSPLAKGEYYVREKCFFDQISRSEGGPRGPTTSTSGRGNYNYQGINQHTMGNSLSGPYSGLNNGPVNVAAARRERQLNLETFGPMAARTTFVSRRRPTGSVPRDLLVSASA